MKLEISKKELRQALNNVHKTVATRSTLPILNNIYLKAYGKEIYLFTTNLESYTEVKIPANVIEEGEITLPARLMLEMVNAISSGSEEITLESSNLKSARLFSGPFNYMLNGIEASEYKEYLPQFNPAFSFFISGSLLKQMINIVRCAVATDESKPSMMGARAELKGNNFRLVATDSRRLAITNCRLAESAVADHFFLIPGKALNEIYTLIDDQFPVKIQLNDGGNIVGFEINNLKFYSRLLEGEFPDYESFIKSECPISFKTETAAFVESLEGIMPIARENANIVKLFIGDGRITLEAASSETGLAKIEQSCEKKGGNLEISFNARYLIDALNSINAGSVELSFNKPLTPCFIKSADGQGDFIWVIMPIRPA
ncbi:MAG: DNA polymerase III subunit beta [Candidatus Wallbacteria bacterium]|nr:DNA polymerase III subunit beta [Candidatus Wallbacteria bacterium]